jgi:hypothetical protein
MPRADWPLVLGRPAIQVVLTLAQGGQKLTRTLLADTGAGETFSPFDLLLDETDCVLCDGTFTQTVTLGGAFNGSYPIYLIRVQIPVLQFDHDVLAVGVPNTPPNLEGIACFRFVNRFSYGNFGNSSQFCLET